MKRRSFVGKRGQRCVLLACLCAALFLGSGAVAAVPDANATQTELVDGRRIVFFAPNAGAVPMGPGGVDFSAAPAVAYADALSVPSGAVVLTTKQNGDGTFSFLADEARLSCGHGAGLVFANADGSDTKWSVRPHLGGYLVCCEDGGQTLAVGVFDGAFTVRPYQKEFGASFVLRFYEASDALAFSAPPTVLTGGIAERTDEDLFETVACSGVLTARIGDYGRVALAVLEDGDGAVEVFDPLLYDTAGREICVGDRVALIATYKKTGVLPYLEHPTHVRILGRAPVRLPAYADLSALRRDAKGLIARAVRVMDVRVGAWTEDGATILTDRNGVELPLYRAAPFPAGLNEGDLADIVCVVEFQADALQLRNASPSDYAPMGPSTLPRLVLLSKQTVSLRADREVCVSATCDEGVAYVRMRLKSGDAIVFTDYLTPKNGEYRAKLPEKLKAGAYVLELSSASVRSPLRTVTETFSLTVQP